jgi:hypothetical protein
MVSNNPAKYFETLLVDIHFKRNVIRSTIFYVVTPYSLIELQQRFRGTRHLTLQGRRIANQVNPCEDDDLAVLLLLVS